MNTQGQSRRTQFDALSAAISEIASRVSPGVRTYFRNAAVGMEAAADTGPLGGTPSSTVRTPTAPAPMTQSSPRAGAAQRESGSLPQRPQGYPRFPVTAAPPRSGPATGGAGRADLQNRSQLPGNSNGEGAPANTDVNKPIYIGGAGQGYKILGMKLTNAMDRYLKDHPGNFYTHWDDEKVREQILRTHAAGQPVVLVGHSWGGSDAIAAARWAKGQNIPIEQLITIDPVGVPRITRRALQSSEPIANNWTTVKAGKPGFRLGDFVADSWGKTPRFIQNEANSLIRDKGAEHADFDRMMKDADAKQKVRDAHGRKTGQ